MSFLRFRVILSDRWFHTDHSVPTGWTHVVGNYIGPNNGAGIRIFINGAEVASDTTKAEWSHIVGDSRIIVGRRYTDCDQKYISVQVDELIYFNASVTSDDVQSVYSSV